VALVIQSESVQLQVLDGEIVPELDALAEQIRAEHEACEESAESAVMHAIRAGELLTEAKAQVRHGKWLPWLVANFEFTRQTASGYMRLAKHRAEMEGAPSISEALKELAEPRGDEQEKEPTEAEREAELVARVAALPDDLGDRVRVGGLAVDEAEAIAVQREQRLDVWANDVRRAINVLTGLAGNPVPAGLLDRLDADEQAHLDALLDGALIDPQEQLA
jgi:hypothetical protein